MHKISLILRALFAAAIIFCILVYITVPLVHMATDYNNMLEKMIKYSDTSASRVDAGEYPKLAAAVTDFLRGKRETAQVEVFKGTRAAGAFSDDELKHLEDIRELVSLAGIMQYIALGMLAAVIIVYFVLRKKWPALLTIMNPLLAFIWSFGIIFAVMLLVAVWGLLDFEGLFYAFHKLLFRNDLWLLDPQTDLLLQMMPLELFISYGLDMIKQSGLLILILLLALTGPMKKKKASV